MHDTSKPTGLKRIFKAFFYSMAGLKQTFQDEAAFRQELLLLIPLLPLVWWLDTDLATKLVILASLALVWVVELLNSAIEAVVDLATEEKHPLAKKAKDAASAAVFIALVIMAVAVGYGIWTSKNISFCF